MQLKMNKLLYWVICCMHKIYAVNSSHAAMQLDLSLEHAHYMLPWQL